MICTSLVLFSVTPKYGSQLLRRIFEQKSRILLGRCIYILPRLKAEIEKGDAFTSPFSIMPKIRSAGKRILSGKRRLTSENGI